MTTKPDYDWARVDNNDVFWVPVKLTPEEECKCLLFEIMIYKSRNNGKYIVARRRDGNDCYVRPFEPNKYHNGSHVEVDSLEECFLLAADPEKFGGGWG